MQKLNETDSDNKVSEYCNRHKHLCHQNINGSKYAEAIAPLLTEFNQKKDELNVLEDTYKITRDIVHLNNQRLNQGLRKLLRRSQEYDMENPGQKVTAFLIPDSKISPLTRLSPEKKEKAMADILRKLQSLSETNGLFSLYEELKAIYDELVNSLAEAKKAQENIQIAETPLMQVKIKLVKQYNDNYHTAAIDYDKDFAEMIYPVIKTKSKKEAEVVETESADAQ